MKLKVISEGLLERIVSSWSSVFKLAESLDRPRMQAQIEKKQKPFTGTELYSVHTGVFTYKSDKDD